MAIDSVSSEVQTANILTLNPPFEEIETLNLNENDFYSQRPIRELAQENFDRKIGYIIAIATNILGQTQIFDGCSFVYYNHHLHDMSHAYMACQFYHLSKNIIPIDREFQEDHSEEQQTTSTKLELTYICDLDNFTNQYFLKFISSHDYRFPTTTPDEEKKISQKRTQAQFEMGLLFELGSTNPKMDIININARNFFQRNDRRAFEFYQRAANDNCEYSCHRIVRYYDEGIQCEKSAQKAFDYLKKAVELSSNCKLFIAALAVRYLNGLGTPCDRVKGLELLSKYTSLSSSTKVS